MLFSGLTCNKGLKQNCSSRIFTGQSPFMLSTISIKGSKHNKKAELWQRWPCDAPNIWVPWKNSRVL